jgi:hypothetical protein
MRHTLILSSFLCFSILCSSSAVFGENRSFAAGRFAFGIDGVFAGYIKKVSGGADETAVAVHSLGTTLVQKKHLSTIKHEPLSFEISMGMGEEMWDWLRDSWDQDNTTRDCQLITPDFDHEVQAVRQFSQAYIKKVRIPAMDVDNPEPGYWNIELDAEEVLYGNEELNKEIVEEDENAHSTKWLSSNFRMELGDLPCKRVAKIDAFSWEQGIVKDEIGPQLQSDGEPAPVQAPSLRLTLNEAEIGPWLEWFKESVVDGELDEEAAKKGSLTFLGPDLEEELATIEFVHVGIISLEQETVEDNKEALANFRVELYVEEMSLIKFSN